MLATVAPPLAFDLESWSRERLDQVERALETWITADAPLGVDHGAPAALVEAMRYSVLDGKTIITIERGEGGLLLNPGSGKSAHLFPESEVSFRIVEGGQITFTRSAAGDVDGFVMYRNGDHRGVRLTE